LRIFSDSTDHVFITLQTSDRHNLSHIRSSQCRTIIPIHKQREPEIQCYFEFLSTIPSKLN